MIYFVPVADTIQRNVPGKHYAAYIIMLSATGQVHTQYQVTTESATLFGSRDTRILFDGKMPLKNTEAIKETFE